MRTHTRKRQWLEMGTFRISRHLTAIFDNRKQEMRNVPISEPIVERSAATRARGAKPSTVWRILSHP